MLLNGHDHVSDERIVKNDQEVITFGQQPAAEAREHTFTAASRTSAILLPLTSLPGSSGR